MPTVRCRFLAVLLPALVLLGAMGATRAAAQEESFGTSFITPFPAGDVYSVQVIGDDLADGLLYGLMEAFQGDSRLQIRNRAYNINGVMRADFAQKLLELDENLKAEPAHIAIVMLGAWDRVSVRGPDGKRLQVGTDPWRTEYAARADRLMKLLKKRNAAVYWVGLPVVRRYDANEDVQMMNNIVRERTYLNGQKYIDAYASFTDESGGYSAYGPDITGKIRLLRAGDGVYFTGAGNRKLAHFVERDMKRDLTQAKASRAIPLAGTEDEQAKINPDKAKLSETDPGAPPGGGASAGPGLPAAAGALPPAAVAPDATGEQKADNSKINLRMVSPNGREELVTVDIVRPAISASLVALVTRRESPDKPSQLGEAVVEQIAGGLTVMNTMALPSTAGTGSGRRPVSPTQTPYFRVLFKGERLPPKAGRADDQTWPPPEPPAQAELSATDDLETGATAGAEGKPQEGAKEPAPRKRRRN